MMRRSIAGIDRRPTTGGGLTTAALAGAFLLAVLLARLVAMGWGAVAVALAGGLAVMVLADFRLSAAVGMGALALVVPPALVPKVGLDYLLLACGAVLALYLVLVGGARRLLGPPLLIWMFLTALLAWAALRGEPGGAGIPLYGCLALSIQALLLAAAPSRIGRRQEVVTVAWAALLVGVVLSLWAIAEFLLGRGLAYPLVSGLRRTVGPFGNPNFFGAVIAEIAVIALSLLVVRWRRKESVLAPAVVLMLAVAGLATTLSKGAMIALVAGAVSVAFLGASPRRRGMMVVALLALTAIAGPLGWRAVTKERLRIAYPSPYRVAQAAEQESIRARYAAAAVALELTAAHPLTGIGLERFPSRAAASPELGIFMNTHNEPLRIAAEAGLPALALLVWLIAYVARRLDRDPEIRMIVLPVLVSYAALSLFMNGLENPRVTFLPLALLSLGSALMRDAEAGTGGGARRPEPGR